MKHIIISLFISVLLFSASLSYSQINNKGATIKVKPGMYMNVKGNLKNSGTIDNAGTIKVTGNYENNGTFTSASASYVNLNGGAQQIGGSNPTTFSNLVIEGTADKQCTVNTAVSHSLSFNSNKISIGNYDLRLMQGATITGADNSKYVVTSGSGYLKARAVPTSADFLFPVGNSASSYKPVTINYTGTVDTFRVRAIAGVTPTTSTDNSAVQTTYQVIESVPGGSNASLKFGWNTVDEGSLFNRSNAVIWQNVSSTWNILGGTPGAASNSPATNWSYQTSGITNLASTAGNFIVNIQSRPLYLSALMLEGLYNAGGVMNEAKDETGNAHWAAGVADKIAVELHSPTYSNVVTTLTDVSLNTSGNATINVPATYNGSYYITIRHRNSLETTTASAVSFAGSSITQSFGNVGNVFGSNMGLSGDGHYLIYAGDVNQDGYVDTGDYIGIDNDSYNYLQGYLVTDVNGDGFVDTGDYIPVDNNNYNYISSVLP